MKIRKPRPWMIFWLVYQNGLPCSANLDTNQYTVNRTKSFFQARLYLMILVISYIFLGKQEAYFKMLMKNYLTSFNREKVN